MYSKILLAVIVILLILITSCSSLREVVYCPPINQGNYFTPNDILKVRLGMTQQQIAYILGTPMMSDPFGTKTWFYVFRQQLGYKNVTQYTLILTFNSNGVLININNKPSLIRK